MCDRKRHTAHRAASTHSPVRCGRGTLVLAGEGTPVLDGRGEVLLPQPGGGGGFTTVLGYPPLDRTWDTNMNRTSDRTRGYPGKL